MPKLKTKILHSTGMLIFLSIILPSLIFAKVPDLTAKDPFDVLGLKRPVTEEQLSAAYSNGMDWIVANIPDAAKRGKAQRILTSAFHSISAKLPVHQYQGVGQSRFQPPQAQRSTAVIDLENKPRLTGLWAHLLADMNKDLHSNLRNTQQSLRKTPWTQQEGKVFVHVLTRSVMSDHEVERDKFNLATIHYSKLQATALFLREHLPHLEQFNALSTHKIIELLAIIRMIENFPLIHSYPPWRDLTESHMYLIAMGKAGVSFSSDYAILTCYRLTHGNLNDDQRTELLREELEDFKRRFPLRRPKVFLAELVNAVHDIHEMATELGSTPSLMKDMQLYRAVSQVMIDDFPTHTRWSIPLNILERENIDTSAPRVTLQDIRQRIMQTGRPSRRNGIHRCFYGLSKLASRFL